MGSKFQVNPCDPAPTGATAGVRRLRAPPASCGCQPSFTRSLMEEVDTVCSVAGAAQRQPTLASCSVAGPARSTTRSWSASMRPGTTAPRHGVRRDCRWKVRYVSLNDHTPGQGQFRDVERYIQWMTDYYDRRGADGLDLDQMHRTIASLVVDTETLLVVYARVLAEAERTPLMLATHDDDSPAKARPWLEAWAPGSRSILVAIVVAQAGARARIVDCRRRAQHCRGGSERQSRRSRVDRTGPGR